MTRHKIISTKNTSTNNSSPSITSDTITSITTTSNGSILSPTISEKRHTSKKEDNYIKKINSNNKTTLSKNTRNHSLTLTKDSSTPDSHIDRLCNNNLNNHKENDKKNDGFDQNHISSSSNTKSEENQITQESKRSQYKPLSSSTNNNLISLSWTAALSTMLHSSATILSRAKHYLSSLRPGTFFTSLIPVLMGTVLAGKTSGGNFSWVILLATLLTVLSVHAAGNLVNTYCDFIRGIDSKRQSDDRTLVDSILTPEEVVNLGVLFYFIGCIGFLIVVLLSPARMELLAFIYFGGLSSSFLYTGGIGLKYIALGDIIIMITFGPVAVLYSFIAQTGTIRLVTLLYAIPLALNTEAILHSNNTRDVDVDRKAGCVTIAMLIGYRASHVLFSLLLFVPYILFVVVSINYSLWLLLPLITLPKAFGLERQFRQRKLSSIPRQMAILNFYFGMFYLFACFMSPAHKLPGLLPVRL